MGVISEGQIVVGGWFPLSFAVSHQGTECRVLFFFVIFGGALSSSSSKGRMEERWLSHTLTHSLMMIECGRFTCSECRAKWLPSLRTATCSFRVH